MDASIKGILQQWREAAELALRKFGLPERRTIEGATETGRIEEAYGISQDTAEALARAAQIATCALEELGNILNCFLDSMATATYTATAVFEELSKAEKAWERAKAVARLHRAQRKRRRAIEDRFRAEIRWAESLRFSYRMFRPPRPHANAGVSRAEQAARRFTWIEKRY